MTKFKTILVPLDGSGPAEKALDCVRALATAFQSRLILFHALELRLEAGFLSNHPLPTHIYDEQDKRCRDYMNDQTAQLESEGLNVSQELQEGLPAESILGRANQGDVDVIVMASHGRTGLGRFLVGSVAERVVRHARCPVLVVR